MLNIIEQADADFICLQEMTSEIYDHFLQNDYIKGIFSAGGSVSPNAANLISYDTIIISKFKCHYYECEFTSLMYRKLILAEAVLPIPLIVASSHFESLDSTRIRLWQLQDSFKILKAA